VALEFDPAKSAANALKHGLDFEAAQAIWRDPGALEAPTGIGREPRFLVIGRIGGRYWTAVCTRRGQNVRIISVPRSRKEEVRRYEGA
jgi:uncharacterized DUF497 family protein